MEGAPEALRERIPTRRREVVLEATGLRHPRSFRFGGRCFSLYGQVTHLALGRFGMRLGTERGVFVLGRRAFRDVDGPERLARSLLARIARAPGGEAQIRRMLALDQRALDKGRTSVSQALVLLCLVGFALQVTLPRVHDAAMFSAPLVSLLGEHWRLVTANFLHGSPLHLLLNLSCLAALGGLAERSLGSAALAPVVAASALGAMLASWGAGYVEAVGASGIVTGLVGSLLWLEFFRPRALPAGWRIPRRIFVGALLLETLVLAFVPLVAHAAHAGGMLAGAAATALVAPPPRRRPWLRLANLGLVALLVLAVGGATRAALGPSMERRALMLLALEEVPPQLLNNEAWRIAVSRGPGPGELDVALRLAQRAVAQTARQDAGVLDTLAEVHFAGGRIDEAVAVIDEAIARDPREPYYREQRRRFLGERAPEDRPPPPGEAPPAQVPLGELPQTPGPGRGAGLP